MFRGDSFEPRYKFVDARVVLHGARAERIHAEVDRMVPRGETREVAEYFDFAHFWKAFNTFAAEVSAERFGWFGSGHVEWRQFERALSRRRLLKDQAFALVRMPRRFFNF